VANVAKWNPGKVTNIEWFSDPRRPARVSFEDRSVVLVNSWTGEVLHAGANKLRGFFRFVTDLHTNLAMAARGKWMVDVANVAFVFLALSGLWLWWPRQWRWKALRSSMAIRLDVGGKARDWNWHNALGFWFLIPIALIAMTGVVLSYRDVDQWWRAFADRNVLAAKKPVTPLPAGNGTADWDGLMDSVSRQNPGWRSMISGRDGTSLTVLMGTVGQRTVARTVGVDRATNSVVKISTWENVDGPLRARMIARLGHTGEILGPWGQTLAFLACLSGLVLTYTGFALSYRRFFRRNV
jgi:uncharacterized iron-regulated membrane protein